MQGLFVSGARPKSKKAVKDAIATTGVADIRIEATSFFGNEYDGPLSCAPDGKIEFCGPNPHSDRRFYGTLTVLNGTVTVK